MAINVYLHSFSKRVNSTKRFTAASATLFQCTLIDDTDLMNPTFKMELGANPIGYNCAYVPDFNSRFYFINNIRTYQGFWYIECTCDVLATFRSYIGDLSPYVLRAASDYDGYISDSHYGGKIKETVIKRQAAAGDMFYWGTPGTTDYLTSHIYIIGITGFDSSHLENQAGSVIYYAFSARGLYNFIYFLMHDISTWSGINTGDYDPNVQQALLNPMQYIVSCMAFPFNPTEYVWLFDPLVSIKFGYYTCPNAYVIEQGGQAGAIPVGRKFSRHRFLGIPKHPQASTRGEYMNGAPFNSYSFHCGPWGDITLDPADLIDCEYLHYKVTVEATSGLGELVIWADNQASESANIQNILYCGQSQVAANIKLSQAIIDPQKQQLNWQNGLTSIVSSGISSLSPSGIASNLLNAQNMMRETYADSIRNKYPSVNSIGVQDTLFHFSNETFGTYLLQKYFEVVDEDNANIGRPLCQKRQLSTLSGYILCENADIAAQGATEEERNKINQYLNTGFFYE